ncbi:bile acid:sodium symporter family protein [Paenibacillus arenilitoris]|uniref:Bile acid:sodium symporter n=1 Tax=Paenibacillus arenilitoris TaxID=2772299 RepID=A0A927CP74_9BACL|nr:bile acid:sodium symporter [Paenibacillus arenilitoris]MBD2870942.1 bile acid:sodium symporter [Paenibacillus arenilitoris]
MSTLNRKLDRYIVLILPLFMLAGCLLHRPLHDASWLVQYLFMLLTLLSSMGLRKEDLLGIFRHPRPALAVLLIAHIGFPLLCYFVLQLVELDASLRQGVLLAMMMPIGITSIAWVALTGGHVGAAVSMVSLSTLLSPLLVPGALTLAWGSQIGVTEQASLVAGLVKLVLLPCAAGIVLGHFVPRTGGFKLAASLASKASLYLIVMLNAAAVMGIIGQIGDQLMKTAILIGAVILAGYVLNWTILFCLGITSGMEVAYTYSGGVRNYTAGLVLAQLYFPPAVAVPVMIAILLQHPSALLAHAFFSNRFKEPRL